MVDIFAQKVFSTVPLSLYLWFILISKFCWNPFKAKIWRPFRFAGSIARQKNAELKATSYSVRLNKIWKKIYFPLYSGSVTDRVKEPCYAFTKLLLAKGKSLWCKRGIYTPCKYQIKLEERLLYVTTSIAPWLYKPLLRHLYPTFIFYANIFWNNFLQYFGTTYSIDLILE